MWLSIIVIDFCGAKFGITRGSYYLISNANKLPVFLCALGMFIYFKNININYNRFINTIAQSVFGVLLIHANSDNMRQFLWNDFLKNTLFYNSPLFILMIHAGVAIFGIFCVGTLIDQLRIHFIEKPFLRLIDRSLLKKEKQIIKLGNKIYYKIKRI